MIRGDRAHGRAAIVLVILTLGVLTTLSGYRSSWSKVWGDEGTFLAMMASLTEDADLRFDERDLARAQAAEGGRTYLILQQSESGVSYSKPVLFALASAPFYLLFGERGPMVLNVLALALALTLAFAYLRRLGAGGTAALVLVSFVGGGVILPYAAWRMTDGFQASLALIALTLCFAAGRGRMPESPGVVDRLLAWRGAPIVGAVLLAALVTMRVSNGVVAAAPVLAALFRRRPRRASTLALTTLATYLLLVGLTSALTGAANPYRATRTTFTPATGYPAGPAAGEALARFDQSLDSDRTGILPHAAPRRIAFSAFYFFFGRHTGLLFYFPAAVVLLIFASRRSDPAGRAALLAFAGATFFFVAWRPENYFGGDTFIGNRYFLSFYPLLLIALPRLPGTRWLAAVWTLAALSYASAVLSVTRHHALDSTSQSHARAGIFRLLPYESTSRDIVGRRDRYWAGHFVRFVDPFPGVRQWHFDLHAGRPPAEMLVAHWRPGNKIRLFVDTSAPEATLEIRDYAQRWSFAVGTDHTELQRGPLGVRVDLRTSRPWRRHRYWWHPEKLYWTRGLRLRLKVPGDGPAIARIRYFGDPATLEESFSYRVVNLELPERAEAGSSSQVMVTLENTSRLIWEREGVVPVRAGYRLHDGSGTLKESERISLPERVEPYDDVEIAFTVAWPEEPGSYRLEVDLELEHIAWFAERLGTPVASREVVVVTARD